ncbi:SGNH/GDSL hydrolase family protein [Coraliomargarita algicola]|uniref:SGNH/GDSL hydrolase family protein n=1 Tax=Coraliomargarita algicola TaxID=3092156 RepID=A0ABZ0RS73_9BACT|nr:SGNH/GDSL hydrolase family protein [Coraliomargarita sp. J2-16]WPJ95809.1 SGNH/GDSL hydrolase family protein [Coraliomargarita sp. J2-16]
MISTQVTTAQSSLHFSEFDQRAAGGSSLTVAFLGGSLTWGAQATDPLKTSYRALVSNHLRERYPQAKFTFVDAAIGGTGSQLGVFRLQRDVLDYQPDLVFLDFTVNDGAYALPTDDRLSSYEAIIRQLLRSGTPVIQVILAMKADVQLEPSSRPLDALHKEIGAAYQLPLADVLAQMRQAVVVEGRATPDELWDLPYDQTHPGDAGYALYAECVWATYLEAVQEELVCHLPETMLHPDHYMQLDRFRLCGLDILPAGWSRGVPHRNAIAFDFVCSRWMDDVAIARAVEGVVPEALKLEFQGQSVLLFGEGTQKSGRYIVRIDGGEAKEYNMYCKDGNMRHVQIIAQGLKPGITHTLEITPKLADGEELRLESVCVAGGAVLALAE